MKLLFQHDDSDGVAKVLVIVWVVILAGVFVADVLNSKRTELRLALGRGSRNLWNGRVPRQLDDYFTRRSFIFTQTRPILAAWIYHLTGEIHTEVGLGREGWLFHQWTFEDKGREGERATEKGIQNLVSMRNVLAGHKVDFLMVVIPSKIRIYPEFYYPSGTLPPYMRSKYQDFLEKLRAQGIAVVDLETLFLREKINDSPDNRLYHTADHHWTDRGCLAAARTIGDFVRGAHLKWCDQMPRVAELKKPYRIGGADSLYRMLGFQTGELRNHFVHDTFRHEILRRVEWTPQQAKDSPFILVGDSFAGFFKLLPSYLEMALCAPVQDFSVMGAEAHNIMEKWIASGGLLSQQPRLLIWVSWEATTIGNKMEHLEGTLK